MIKTKNILRRTNGFEVTDKFNIKISKLFITPKSVKEDIFFYRFFVCFDMRMAIYVLHIYIIRIV